MSSGNCRLTALSQRVSLFRTQRFKTPKLGQLTYFTYLQNIVNIAKIHRLYSWDARGWCSDKKYGILLSVDASKKKPNQHRTLHQDPQQLGQSHYNKQIVVINCMTIPKYTLIGYISFSNGGWRKIDLQ